MSERCEDCGCIAGCACGPPETRQSEESLRANYRKLEDEIERLREEGSAHAHLIVENGIVPGLTASCRCEECRAVAQRMDAAGFLDRVVDRWWEETIGPQRAAPQSAAIQAEANQLTEEEREVMFELRWNVGPLGCVYKILEYRQRTPLCDASGAWCDWSEWSEWQPVLDFYPQPPMTNEDRTRREHLRPGATGGGDADGVGG